MIINVYLGYDKLLLDVCFAKFFIFRIPLIFLLIFAQLTTYKRSEINILHWTPKCLRKDILPQKYSFSNDAILSRERPLHVVVFMERIHCNNSTAVWL